MIPPNRGVRMMDSRYRPARSSETGFAGGFTLVELVIVISIAAALAATLGPKVFTLSTFSERGYTDELAAALRYTQKAAVITGCPARLTVAPGSYVAAQQAVSGNTCDPADVTWSTPIVGPDGAAIAGTAPSGTTASPAGVFQFDDQGRLAGAPGTTLGIGARSITIVAGTGFVQVQ
jgi:prepilin-type N-terminal cleavage/methylation domain-containing protein